MFNKLAFRNAKRSIKDYFLYLVTMILITSLMFAFNSMIFSEDIIKIFSMAGVMAAMIGLATFFIIFVVAWLINYMIRFMMEKKSKEFGTYILLGMKKKEVKALFIRENIIIGIIGFLLGILPGIFLQQIFTTIFYSMFAKEYLIKIEFSIESFLLTAVLYIGIYLFALFKSKKKFKKMTIKDMMITDKENESLTNKNEKAKVILCILSVICFIVLDVMLIMDKFNSKSMWIFLALLIVSIYLFYKGVSSLVVSYIKKEGNGIFNKEKLFLLRQFASKIKTMEFTMATLTILFIFSIIGCSIAMMLGDYLNKSLDAKLPFDIIAFSDSINDDFEEYIDVIEKNTKIKDKFIYNIYEDGTDNINMYLRNEFKYFKDENSESNFSEYFDYDTYMKVSDYNKLRKMLGYSEVTLSHKGFFIQGKKNIMSYLENYLENKTLSKNNYKLSYEGSYTEAFSQDGQNGADYIIVIPDKVAESMTKFYSNLAVDIEGEAPVGLQDELMNIEKYYGNDEFFEPKITYGSGSDQILTFGVVVMVKTELADLMKFLLTSISFPFIYIGLVFLCVALTVLSVQQISDSSKYKYRYDVLRKLGLKDREVNRVILKQLLVYYMAPLIMAIIISVPIVLYVSNKFIYFTAINSSVFLYFGISITALLVVYVIYFIATYVEFKKNINVP